MAEPYYADEHVTLYHGDCLEVRDWLEADVLVTDPPYGINWRADPTWTGATGSGGQRTNGGAVKITGDSDTAVRDAALALWGSKQAIVFGDVLRHHPVGSVHNVLSLATHVLKYIPFRILCQP